jgi:hypothetical protein
MDGGGIVGKAAAPDHGIRRPPLADFVAKIGQSAEELVGRFLIRVLFCSFWEQEGLDPH